MATISEDVAQAAADSGPTSLEAWSQLISAAKSRYGEKRVWLSGEHFRIAQFVDGLPATDLPLLLIHANQRYRALDPTKDDEYIESACCSILISTIHGRVPTASESEALAILSTAYHHCGHGSDVAPPLDLALSFYVNRLYSLELMDAASRYRDSLRKVRARATVNTRRRLLWIIWHDPRKIERACHTRKIQLALSAMDEARKLAWEMLFRHNSLSVASKPGKEWLRRAQELLAAIEPIEFVERLDEWFTFDEQTEVSVGYTGWAMLRTLIWCGYLTTDQRVLPILCRLRTAKWKKRNLNIRRKLLNALEGLQASSAQAPISS